MVKIKFKYLINKLNLKMLSLPSLFNVGALLILVMFIYSILGCFAFGSVKSTGKIINDYNNFHNFHNAILTLFRCATGEDWYSIMFEVSESCILFLYYFN
jgi:hypothetical protein